MKKTILILACVVLTSAAFGQKGKYTIKCTADAPVLNGLTAYLQIHRPGGVLELDSCVVRKGRFSFKGEVEGNTTADIVFSEYLDIKALPFLFGFEWPQSISLLNFHKFTVSKSPICKCEFRQLFSDETRISEWITHTYNCFFLKTFRVRNNFFIFSGQFSLKEIEGASFSFPVYGLLS